MGSLLKGAAGGGTSMAGTGNPYAIAAGTILGGLQGKKAGDAAKGAGRTGMTGLPKELGGWKPIQEAMAMRKESTQRAMDYRPFQNNPFSDLLRRRLGSSLPGLGNSQGGFGGSGEEDGGTSHRDRPERAPAPRTRPAQPR